MDGRGRGTKDNSSEWGLKVSSSQTTKLVAPTGSKSTITPPARVKGFALAFFLVAWVMTPLPPATGQMHELMRLLGNTVALVMAMTIIAKIVRD